MKRLQQWIDLARILRTTPLSDRHALRSAWRIVFGLNPTEDQIDNALDALNVPTR